MLLTVYNYQNQTNLQRKPKPSKIPFFGRKNKVFWIKYLNSVEININIFGENGRKHLCGFWLYFGEILWNFLRNVIFFHAQMDFLVNLVFQPSKWSTWHFYVLINSKRIIRRNPTRKMFWVLNHQSMYHKYQVNFASQIFWQL